MLRLQDLLLLRLKVFNASLLDDLLDFLGRINNMDSFTSIESCWLQNPNIVAIVVASGHDKWLLEF